MQNIHVQPEQSELLRTFVEAYLRTPKDGREPFMCKGSATSRNLFVAHSGVPKEHPGAYPGDLDALAAEGLVRMTYTGGSSRNVDLTPLAFQYYEWLQRQAGEPVERVEREVRSFVDGERFRCRYPKAYAKWKDAEQLLWVGDAEAHFSTVGHLCREALQEYADALVTERGIVDVPSDRAKTAARMHAVFRSLKTGSREAAFLAALLDYWGTLSDLVQRQEHAAAKEGEPIAWEDGRRVAFHTLLVMHEVDQTVARQR